MCLAIGVDVGGTKVAAGVVDEQGRIVEKLRRPTPSSSPEQTAITISDVVAELMSRHAVGAVGLGVAGFVDEARAHVVFAPNLAWRGEPVQKVVQDRLGVPVVVENDANATVWAETRFGAAHGDGYVILITVGTGIGCGIVVDGELYRGRWGIGGEAGHYRVVPDGRLCGCGNRGCWEQYASGNALVAEARDFARRSPAAAVRLLELAGGTPDGIAGPEITLAATEGDPAALRCFSILDPRSPPGLPCPGGDPGSRMFCRGRRRLCGGETTAGPGQGGVREGPHRQRVPHAGRDHARAAR